MGKRELEVVNRGVSHFNRCLKHITREQAESWLKKSKHEECGCHSSSRTRNAPYNGILRRRCFLRFRLEKPPSPCFSTGRTSSSHIQDRSFTEDPLEVA